MNTIHRKPVWMNPANTEMLKSQASLSGSQPGATDHLPSDNIEIPVVRSGASSYNAPSNRENGNLIFRRYPDGSLELDAAKNVIVDIIHKVKSEGPLTDLEKVVLGVMFPEVWATVDPNVIHDLMRVQLRITPAEASLICEAVARHIITEMNWNAGKGGGFAPGTLQVRS
jgi:hypothetical protein